MADDKTATGDATRGFLVPRVPPKIIHPLKQFGSLWIERIETVDSEAQTSHRYDFVYREHRTMEGQLERRLEYIQEYRPALTEPTKPPGKS